MNKEPTYSKDLLGYISKVESFLRNTKLTESEDLFKQISDEFLQTFGTSYTSTFMLDLLKVVQPHLFDMPGQYTLALSIYNQRKGCMINNQRAKLKSAIKFYSEIYYDFTESKTIK